MGKSRTTRFVLALLMFASLGAVAGADSQQQSPSSSSSPQTWNQICTQNPSNPLSPSWNKILQQSNPSPGNTHWNQLITANTYPDHLCPYTPGCQTIQGACATIAGTYGIPAGYTLGNIVLHDCGGTITTNQGGCSQPPPGPVPHAAAHASVTLPPPLPTSGSCTPASVTYVGGGGSEIQMDPFYPPVCNITGASGVTIYPAIPASGQCYSRGCNSGYDNSNAWQGYGPNKPVNLQYGVPSSGVIHCLSSGYGGCNHSMSYSWDGIGTLKTLDYWYTSYYWQQGGGCAPGETPIYGYGLPLPVSSGRTVFPAVSTSSCNIGWNGNSGVYVSPSGGCNEQYVFKQTSTCLSYNSRYCGPGVRGCYCTYGTRSILSGCGSVTSAGVATSAGAWWSWWYQTQGGVTSTQPVTHTAYWHISGGRL